MAHRARHPGHHAAPHAVNIRRFVLQAHSLDELIATGTLTAQAARFLEAAVAAGVNVLVSGSTQAGKTTLLNCLVAAIPVRERVITCEEVFELSMLAKCTGGECSGLDPPSSGALGETEEVARGSVPEVIGQAVGALPASKNQLKRLGQRLVAGSVSADDQALYDRTIAFYDDLQAATVTALESISWDRTVAAPERVRVAGRAKTLDTLLQKLERTPEIGLANVRDVAGVRVIGDFTVFEQDRVVDVIRELFQCPEAQVIDRRAQPEAGYRAVHVVLPLCGVHVEVQVRTRLQHQWAELFERLADRWGRQLRYGGDPDPADGSELAETRKELVARLQATSVELIAGVEDTNARVDLLRRAAQGTVASDDATLKDIPELKDIAALEDIAERVAEATVTAEQVPGLPAHLYHPGNLLAVMDWLVGAAKRLVDRLGETLLEFHAQLVEDEEGEQAATYDEEVTGP